MKKCKFCGGRKSSNLFYCSAECRKSQYEKNRKMKKTLRISRRGHASAEITKNIFKIFLHETYLEAGKEIKIGIDKLLFARGVKSFFKEEVNLFCKNNFEDTKMDLDVCRLNNLSYTEIISEVCDWYIGEVELTKLVKPS